MFKKKRIELIIESMAVKRAGRIMESAGMTGYTVLPAKAGFGGGRHWRRDTDISTSQDLVVMIAIGNPDRVTKSMELIEDLLGNHVGVVSVSDVEVLRDDRF